MFLALPLAEALRAELQRFQTELAAKLPPGSVRWNRPGQIHLTLKFLGAVRAAEIPQLTDAVRGACANAAAMRLKAVKFDCFPNAASPRVLWIGVNGDVAALARLQQRLTAATEAFGDHRERENFSPHLTLGRVQARRPREIRALGCALAGVTFGEQGEWWADTVELAQSVLHPSGAIYHTLAQVPLHRAG